MKYICMYVCILNQNNEKKVHVYYILLNMTYDVLLYRYEYLYALNNTRIVL